MDPLSSDGLIVSGSKTTSPLPAPCSGSSGCGRLGRPLELGAAGSGRWCSLAQGPCCLQMPRPGVATLRCGAPADRGLSLSCSRWGRALPRQPCATTQSSSTVTQGRTYRGDRLAGAFACTSLYNQWQAGSTCLNTKYQKARSGPLVKGSCRFRKHRSPAARMKCPMQGAKACTDAGLLDGELVTPCQPRWWGWGGVLAALVSTPATSSLVGSWAFRYFIQDAAASPCRTDTAET